MRSPCRASIALASASSSVPAVPSSTDFTTRGPATSVRTAFSYDTKKGLPRDRLTLLVPVRWHGEDVPMPKRFPPEFKRDVVAVARRGDLTKAEVAADFDISVESVIRWCRQADVDDGVKDG